MKAFFSNIFRCILCISLLPTLSFYGSATTIDVCNSCDINNIQKGVESASPYDTLLLQAGVYKEYDIQINKALTIVGIDFPVIDGQNKGEIITITADDVTVDGIFIKNVGISFTEDFAAIRVVKSQNFLIKNVVLENLFFGIYLEKSRNGKVINNKIIGEAKQEYNSGNGIQLWYCKSVQIADNYIQGVRDGIYFEFSDSCEVVNNVSTKNVRYGLHFMFSNNDEYRENTFEENGAGVAVMFSKHILMIDNNFKNNWGSSSYGLLLKEITDAEIQGNTFEYNTIGINIEGTNRMNYTKNSFIGNGWAIKVRGACYANIFRLNNFLYNSFDVAYNSNVNDNLFENNYWSNYPGYDLNKDGIGDIPYRPVKLFSYIVNRTPETIILLRSLFVDLIDFSEKVSPVFTPDDLQDLQPLMKKQQ